MWKVQLWPTLGLIHTSRIYIMHRFRCRKTSLYRQEGKKNKKFWKLWENKRKGDIKCLLASAAKRENESRDGERCKETDWWKERETIKLARRGIYSPVPIHMLLRWCSMTSILTQTPASRRFLHCFPPHVHLEHFYQWQRENRTGRRKSKGCQRWKEDFQNSLLGFLSNGDGPAACHGSYACTQRCRL